MVTETQRLETYISKEATQQAEFLKKYPEFDGRGILIAIIDSKITDVSLPGMQKTTTGLPKITECFDFSFDRFVDTATVKDAECDNSITGLSTLQLKIPSNWQNPSGKWHLGLLWFKCLYIQKETENENKECRALEQKLKATEEMKSDQSLPSYVDCIVWFDGEKWRACIDTSISKDVENVKILTNYRDEHEFGYLWNKISYCINIHNDGNQLEVISAYYTPKNETQSLFLMSHGTIISHVAAHFPEEPHKNGL